MKFRILFIGFLFQVLLANAQNNIGIGTTSPSMCALLDLTSTSKGFLLPRMTYTQRTAIGNLVAGLMIYQTNSGGFPVQSSGLYFYDGSNWKRIARADEIGGGGGSSGWTVSGDDQYSNLNGNVGIGTSSPGQKFHLVGNLLMENGNATINSTNATLTLQSAGVNKGFFQLNGNNVRLGNSSGNSGGEIHFRNNSITRMMIDSTGKIGIGTTSPETKLDIVGGQIQLSYPGSIGGIPYAPMLKFVMTAEDEKKGGLQFIRDGSILAGIQYVADADGPNYINVSGNGSSQHDLLVNSVSRVGINMNGTLFDPLAQLHIRAADNVDAIALHTVFSSQNPTIQFYNSSSLGGNPDQKRGYVQLSNETDLRLGTNSGNTNGNFIIRMNGSDKVTVLPSGFTGIGTTTPNSRLDVAGKLRVVQNGENIALDGNDPQISFYRNGAFHSWIGQYADYTYIASNDILRLDGDQIAIGAINNNASIYKLTVAGKVICEELKVELYGTWPDYVFANEYQLKPLDELKTFIEVNHHLPNIPKAADVARDGFEVGEMNRRLLEKVEELTLYVIQLKEEVDNLKKANEKVTDQ